MLDDSRKEGLAVHSQLMHPKFNGNSGCFGGSRPKSRATVDATDRFNLPLVCDFEVDRDNWTEFQVINLQFGWSFSELSSNHDPIDVHRRWIKDGSTLHSELP